MEEKLIEQVRERAVLYNHGSRDYRDQHIRQTAWEEVGKVLNISGSIIETVKLVINYNDNIIYFLTIADSENPVSPVMNICVSLR